MASGLSKQEAEAAAALRRDLAKDLEEALSRFRKFWLGLVFVDDAAAAAEAQEIGIRAAAANGKVFTERRARRVEEMAVTLTGLLDRSSPEGPTWLDWAPIARGDEAVEGLERALAWLYDSYEELRAAHRDGLVIVAQDWTYRAWIREAADRRGAADLWRERVIETRLRTGPAVEPRRAWEPADWLGGDWLAAAPADVATVYEREGATAALAVLMPIIDEISARGESCWDELRALLRLGAALAWAGSRDAHAAFPFARRALAIADNDSWEGALQLARELKWGAGDELEGWAKELAGQAPKSSTHLQATSAVFESRRFQALTAIAGDVARAPQHGRDARLTLSLNRMLAVGEISNGEVSRGVQLLNDTLVRCERTPSIGPYDPLTIAVRADLAKASAAQPDAEGPSTRNPSLPPSPAVVQESCPIADSHVDVQPDTRWIAEFFEKSGIGPEVSRKVLRTAADGVILRRASHDGVKSRLGGPALLPLGEEWPLGPEGWPLVPVAVIDMTEMPRLAPLPAEGTLVLYWDQQGWFAGDVLSSARVIWLPQESFATRADDGICFPAVPLTGVVCPIVGNTGRLLASLGSERDQGLTMSALGELEAKLYAHQLLGPPREIQGDIFEELAYELKRVAPERQAGLDLVEPTEWTLLAQINEEEDIVFADGGTLYFLIPKGDLYQRSFDLVAVILQSH